MRRNSPRIHLRLARRRHELPLFAEAIFWLLVAWLLLGILPFWRLVRTLNFRPGLKVAADDDLTVQRIGWAVTTAARHVPWRAVCIHQGIAAQRMLMRRSLDCDLVYGIEKCVSGTIEAHVWVVAGGRVVVGGGIDHRFTPIAIFKSGSGVAAFDPANKSPGR